MSADEKVAKKIYLVEPWLPAEYADQVRNQVLSGWIGPGPKTKAFEKELADYVHSDHCMLTVSGTMALSIAALALGLRPGDEILVPAYGVISTINAFASIGLKPRLVDIDLETGCLSLESLQDRVTSESRAVCFVDFSGYTGESLIKIKSFCQSKGIYLIEDAACAIGHSYQGQFAGTFGDIGTYSFSVPKLITTGQGGALVTKNKDYYNQMVCIADQGDLNWRKTNLNQGIGNNLRFNDIQASLGLAQLNDIQTRMKRKKAVYEILRESLKECFFQTPDECPSLHNIVLAQDPDDLISALSEQGVAAVRQYRTISQHPAFKELSDAAFPIADYWTNHSVYLPFGMALSVEDGTKIVDAIKQSGTKLLFFRN